MIPPVLMSTRSIGQLETATMQSVNAAKCQGVARSRRRRVQLQRPFRPDLDMHEHVERLRDDRLGHSGKLTTELAQRRHQIGGARTVRSPWPSKA